MTSNQIANSAQREDARHNAATEEEIKRHNKAVEDYNSQSLEYTRLYNQEKMALDERLNKLNLEFQQANEGRKREIESEQLHVNGMLAQAEANYKANMYVVETSKANADKRYKEAMANVAEINANLAAKAAYYENQRTEAATINTYASMYFSYLNTENERKRIQNQYNLGLISSSQRDTELRQVDDRLKLERDKWEEAMKDNTVMDTWKKGSEVISNIVGAARNLVNGFTLMH